jgi:hypothetical protein
MTDRKKQQGEKSYRLKDKEAGFFDDETGLDITRDQVVKIGEGAGKKTLQMVRTGGLIEVNMEPKPPSGFDPNFGSGAPSAAASEWADSDELPEEYPGRAALLAAGYNKLSFVNALTREQLIDLKGIGEKTADEILALRK